MDIVLGMQQVCNLFLFFMEAFNLETVEEHSKGHWGTILANANCSLSYTKESQGPFQKQHVNFIES